MPAEKIGVSEGREPVDLGVVPVEVGEGKGMDSLSGPRDIIGFYLAEVHTFFA